MNTPAQKATQAPAGGGDLFADLARIEDHVHDGRGEEAFAELARMLGEIERGRAGGSAADDDGRLSRFTTRLALASTQLLTDPAARLSRDTYERLANHQQFLAASFRLSGRGATDDVLDAIARQNGASVAECVLRLSGDDLRKFLLACSLDSRYELPWDRIFERDADTALPMYLALIRTRVVLSPEAEQKRNALLEFAEAMARAAVANTSVESLCRAWMVCSYATVPDRHAPKIWITRLIGDLLGKRGFRSLPISGDRPRKDRPTILVGAEVLRSDHAMFRCYASYFMELKRAFRLVLAARRGAVDETTIALFDQFVDVRNLPQIVQAIKELRPDLIFYPSLGMETWTVLLANLRLAPIQLASLGHPATTRSPCIDYMVMGTALFGGEKHFSETVMLLRSAGNLYVPHPRMPKLSPEIRQRPNPLRVAVVSKVMKLNAPFLALCRRVRDRAGRPLQFVFFPGESGFSHLHTRAEITRWLPDATVHPSAPYREYLLNLMSCDVRLSTFPFGGANSNVDGFLLGIPAVVFRGGEPHSRTDWRLARLMAQPEWLTAENEQEYEAAALRLIEDDEARVGIARRILDADPKRAIFEQPRDFHPNDYVDLFSWIYRNHEMIGASGRKVWTWDDRVQVDSGSRQG